MFGPENTSLLFIWSCSGKVDTTENNTDVVAVCPVFLALAILPALLSMFTVVGNIFVITVVCWHSKLNKKRTSILIQNLALADLLVGLVVMPFSVLKMVSGNVWLFGSAACRAWISLDVICSTASIGTVSLISLDRFVGVTRPLQYPRIVTKRRLTIACLVLWVFSVSTLLATIRWHTDGRKREWYVCYVGDELKYVEQSVLLSFFIPLAVILFVYYRIYRITRRREDCLIRSAALAMSSSVAAVASAQVSAQSVQEPPANVANGKLHSLAATGVPQSSSCSVSQAVCADVSVASVSSSVGGSQQQHHLSVVPATTTDGTASIHDQISELASEISTKDNLPPPNKWKQSRPSLALFQMRVHYGGGAAAKKKADGTTEEKSRRNYMKHRKSSKTLGLVVGAFLVCWVPFFLLYFINHVSGIEIVPGLVLEFCCWLGYCNSAINPVIYSLTMRTFKESFLYILRHNCIDPVRKRSSPAIKRVRQSVRRTMSTRSKSRRRRQIDDTMSSSDFTSLQETESLAQKSGLPATPYRRHTTDRPRPKKLFDSLKKPLSAFHPHDSIVELPRDGSIPRLEPNNKISKSLVVNYDERNRDDEMKVVLCKRRVGPQPTQPDNDSTEQQQNQNATSLPPTTSNGGDSVTPTPLTTVVTGPPTNNERMAASCSWMNLKLYKLLISNQSTDV